LFDLSGKTACVTGASAGLGEYAARFLVQSGVAVVGVARRGDRLQQWQQASGGRTAAVVADLSDTATVPEVARQVCAAFGPPDILINAAGINTRQSAGEVTPQGWAVTLDLNLTAPFFFGTELCRSDARQRLGADHQLCLITDVSSLSRRYCLRCQQGWGGANDPGYG
jgi:gluconate 5-dehydrogenase